MRRLIAMCVLVATGALAAEALRPPLVAPFSAAVPGALPHGWKPLTFRDVPRSSYALVRDGEATVVRAEADASASGLAYRVEPPVAPAAWLRWHWKAERLPADGDTRHRDSDDAAARIYVTFGAPPTQRTTDRLRDAALRLIYGEAPPYATLLYVWDTRAPAGAMFANAYTDRVRNVVVESGAARVGQWLAYERDVAADYRRAFGSEAPPISGVALMTDADNTKSRASAWFGDVSLDPR